MIEDNPVAVFDLRLHWPEHFAADEEGYYFYGSYPTQQEAEQAGQKSGRVFQVEIREETED